MKSVWMAEPAKLEVREIPVPEISPEEVLLKIEYAGICGSDLHIYHNTHSFRFPPVIVGHEVAGTIVKVGAHVERLKVGDRVAVLPMHTCGTCEWCQKDLPAHCPERYMPGQDPWIGACVEYLNVDQRLCYQLPEDVDTKLGALCEPLAVAVHALSKIPEDKRDSVLMMGAGAIGHLAVIAARGMGFQKVIVSDIVEKNIELALENGADFGVNVSRENLAKAIEKKYGDGVQGIVITAGSKDVLKEAISVVRKTGYIVTITMAAGDMPFPMVPFIFSESHICASLNYNDADFKQCLALLSREKARFEKAITHVVPFEAAQEIFDTLVYKKEPTLKAMFKV